ncbi:hypothetical protein [Nitratireductor sp. XY-223]|uniref:hypothetical protein n=1 Tax=Nitratireductor sp. XY-223 TaxID=2561926 RepID=UPI0010A99770|nr:hypothetical protein [Nitratireductor sp. XY-223]
MGQGKRTILTGIRRAFLRHQLWVVNWSLELPVISTLFVGTLFVWFVAPALVLSPLYIYLIHNGFLGNGNLVANTVVIFFSGVAAVALFVWLWEWYLISVCLMFGAKQPAFRKQEELQMELSSE